MFKPYEIIHEVHQRFRGLPGKLEGITNKSEDWHRSHGYQPKTENPDAYGNVSDTAKYVTMCRQYEAAWPGAGRMLSNRIHRALAVEFAATDSECTPQAELEVVVIDECSDVQKWLAKQDIDHADRASLIVFEDECDQAIDELMRAKARARLRKRTLELSRNGEKKLRIA